MSRPRRLVLMQINTDHAADLVREVHASFEDIPGVRCAVAAQRPELLDGTPGFTHLSMFEFTDIRARAEYHTHPIHLRAPDRVRSHATDVVVVDLD